MAFFALSGFARLVKPPSYLHHYKGTTVYLPPTVEQAKGKRDPHFIKKDQVMWVKLLYLLPERVSLFLVSLQSDFGFFLKLKRSFLRTRVAVEMERTFPSC